METLLVYEEGTSHKFWKIHINRSKYTVTFGKVGTAGSLKVKEFDSPEECQKEAQKLIKSKLKKGYKPVESSMSVIKESKMTEKLFWELLNTAKKKGEDDEEQIEWLISHLARRPVKDILMFDRIFNQHYVKSYTSNLWAAAYIIMGGCSDDCFDYFRAWLLYQGKDTYEAAIKDPETMISVLKPLEEESAAPQLEDLLSAACLAYEEKTGLEDNHYYDLYEQFDPDYYIEPEIEFDWQEDDEEGLQKKFPKLWNRYWDHHLEY